MICKIRICPTYDIYESYNIYQNSIVYNYHDEDYHKMYQLSFIIETDNKLLIELLEDSNEIAYQTGQYGFDIARDNLVILDNIFLDNANMANDVSEYLDKNIYHKYKSIINIGGIFTHPTNIILDKEVDKEYKVDLIYIGEPNHKGDNPVYNEDDSSIENGNIKHVFDFYE